MHKVFGIQENVNYIDRVGLEETGYKVSVGHKVCSAGMYCKHQTIGYFHPIQTYYVGALLEQVSIPMEDDHAFVWMDYNELKGNMYLEMQSWVIEQCMEEIS